MKRTALILTLASIMLARCGPKENQVVEEVKGDGSLIKVLYVDRISAETIEMNLSDLFTGFEIIPLETNSDCFLAHASQISFTKNNLFVGPQNVSGGGRFGGPGPASLLRFDRKGFFINKIGQGGIGPGEHQGFRINSITLNNESEEIYVDWQPDSEVNELMHYKYDGTFIREIPVPMKFLSNKTRYADNKWIALGKTTGKNNYGAPEFLPGDSVAMVFFSDNGEISRIIPRQNYPPSHPGKYSPWGGQFIYYQNDEYFIYMDGVDTIFKVMENNLLPNWKIDRGKDAIPYNTNIDRQALAGKHDIQFVAETGKNLILRKSVYGDFSNFQTIIVDKQTNKAAYVDIIDDVFGFKKPEDLINTRSVEDRRISMSWDAINYIRILKENNIDPESLIRYSTNPERLRNLSEDSNPVIITFNLKSHIRIN